MKIYFAPLEGITGFSYRNIHHRMFGNGIDRYFAPFVSARQTLSFETKEKKDIDPKNNAGISLVPQILANKPGEFVWAAREMAARGYSVVNLNLGCPMPTVVTKRKGSGLLDNLHELGRLLDAVFDGIANDNITVSIKTRLGKDHCDDACRLVELYNQYPLEELIIHARCQKDMFSGPVRKDTFAECIKCSKHNICYNGDIFSKEDYEDIINSFGQYQNLTSVMIARGVIANPALCREIRGGNRLTKSELRSYHDALYKEYAGLSLGTNTLLHRMKELWFYIGRLFVDAEKETHKIRISKTLEHYQEWVEKIFRDHDIGNGFTTR